MSYSMAVESPDLQKQVDLLRVYPEIVEKHGRALMKKDVQTLYSTVLAGVPSRRGRTTLRKTLTGKGIDMQGKVGWWGKNSFYPINILEYGAKPHPIDAPKGKFLRLLDGTLVKHVDHPGFAGRKFMEAAYSKVQPTIEADLQTIGNAIVQELAIK